MGRPRSDRRRARELAFRLLYEMEMTGDAPPTVLHAEDLEEKLAPPVRTYAAELLERVAGHRAEIDTVIARHARRWSLERLAATDRAVLRLAVAELLYEPDVPGRVVLDEAIEIARRFGDRNSGGFVNGVLDAVWREIDPEKKEA
jgi:N utilization substance protein B